MEKQYISLLKKFVSFKSISTNPIYKPQIEETVQWLKKTLSDGGLDVNLWETEHVNPVIFAKYGNDPTKKTVLIYGHYDVQPAEIEQGWKSDPFVLVERDGGLVARGVVDNKGQILIHMYTVMKLIKEKKLKYNIKFLIEGNEETGNVELAGLLKKYKEHLSTDIILVSDGEVIGKHPVVEESLRGGFNVNLHLKTGKNDLHSGLYGGAVPNALHELGRLTAAFYDDHNHINIPEFYNGCDKITKEQQANNQSIPTTQKELIQQSGVKKLIMEDGYDFYTQVGLLPTIQVTGISGGYTGIGFANIVPCQAHAKINVRIAPTQDPQRIYRCLQRFIKKTLPSYVEYEIEIDGPHHPIKFDLSAEVYQNTKDVLSQVYGTKTLVKNVGGALPILSEFREILGVETISVSLGNDDCNMHGPNEIFKKWHLEKGLLFSQQFFS